MGDGPEPAGKSDLELLQCYLKGDENAFDELDKRYFRVAWLTARGLGVGPEDCADVAQEALAGAAYAARSYKTAAGSVGTWIRAIARNAAIDFLRRRSTRRADRHDSLDSAPDGVILTVGETLADGAPDPFALLECKERGEIVRRCLDRLTPQQRAAVMMFHDQGWNHREIARAMGISVIQSQAYVSRGRARLKEFVEEEMGRRGRASGEGGDHER
jgi:RNA polymerase sigma-70 factor (ECF subfamily)